MWLRVYFSIILFSLIMRNIGVSPFITEGLIIGFSLIFFINKDNIKLITILSLIVLLKYLFSENITLIIYEVWFILIISIISSGINLDRSQYYIFLWIVVIINIIFIFIDGLDLSYRLGLLFEGPLALGFFASTLAILISIIYDDKRKYIYLAVPLAFGIISGSRHPTLVIFLIILINLFYDRSYKIILAVSGLILFVFLFNKTPNFIPATESADRIVSNQKFRAFSTDASSDNGRIESWKHLSKLDNIKNFSLGVGRDKTGNVGMRLYGESIVIESSYGTLLLSEGVLGFFLYLYYLYNKIYKEIIQRESRRVLLIFLVLLLEPLISQRFETPSIMILYFLSFYSLKLRNSN